MKILNLYAGIGGNRKLRTDVEVTAVERDEATAEVYQSYFPDDTVIVGDAHEYLLKHYKEFDFIRSSPPCPTHSRMLLSNETRFYAKWKMKYPDMKLYQEIILLKSYCTENILWCIENVISYYQPLIPPQERGRHYFRSNFYLQPYRKEHWVDVTKIHGSKPIYWFDLSETNVKDKRKALRNMVNPDLWLHILECAKNRRKYNQWLFW